MYSRAFLFPPKPNFPLQPEPPARTRSQSASATSTLEREDPLVSAAAVLSPNREQPDILVSPARIYELFCRNMDFLWYCWELVLMGEPILVVADTPKGASDAVFTLLELIKPVPFGGDFRPYFTIQDSDFKNICAKGRVFLRL